MISIQRFKQHVYILPTYYDRRPRYSEEGKTIVCHRYCMVTIPVHQAINPFTSDYSDSETKPSNSCYTMYWQILFRLLMTTVLKLIEGTHTADEWFNTERAKPTIFFANSGISTVCQWARIPIAYSCHTVLIPTKLTRFRSEIELVWQKKNMRILVWTKRTRETIVNNVNCWESYFILWAQKLSLITLQITYKENPAF